jgi:hypothetical protein
MSQARAIEESSSNLRLLPLPGRVDGAALDRSGAVLTDNAVTRAPATRGIAGQSKQTDSFFAVNYNAQITVPQPASNKNDVVPNSSRVSGGVALSDDVVGFLLSANEVVHGNEGASNVAAITRPSAGLGVYQDVAASFPRTQSSLFSLAT